MHAKFIEALETILARNDPPKPPPAKIEKADAAPRLPSFADFAAEHIMPLLEEAAELAKRHGLAAASRLGEVNDRLTAELVILPRHLPHGTRPPRLTIYAAGDERPLEVEYTGTFPGIGVDGRFGAEVDYDAIYPSQIEERILEFVALAIGD